MPERWSHGISLAVFIPVGIKGDYLEHQVAQGTEQFDISIACETLRILSLSAIGGGRQILQLPDDALVKEECPAVPRDHNSTSPSISALGSTG